MEIHVQKCQFCASEAMKNILYREAGEPDRVYVQCQACQEFVASYVLGPMGYYHHGKGYDSFLRSFHRSGEFMSGRKVRSIFEKLREKEVNRFQEVLQKLEFRDRLRKESSARETKE